MIPFLFFGHTMDEDDYDNSMDNDSSVGCFCGRYFLDQKFYFTQKLHPFFHNNIFAFLHQFLCAPKILRF